MRSGRPHVETRAGATRRVAARLPEVLTRAVRLCRAFRPAQAPIYTEVNAHPRAFEHRTGWRRVLAGDPVEIGANDGGGFKVMTINEYSSAWKVQLPPARLRGARLARRGER